MIEIPLQGDALLLIPLEEEFILKVKDALGHILSWPRHLVIRCSDLWLYVNNILFNKIKYGPPERDHGICCVNPIVFSPSNHKGKSKNIDDASRSVADQLSTRNGNDIILLSYNLRRHWVLVVLDMKLATCYYRDSLSSSNVNL
ncbi:unnamed protein product [Lactuca virosa]|uniref:Ubiquitin-like protease family profile domain-containing protein n=1 Tax=Lactuca virosa TaxID=75947 RepID=A0AAU9N187_9ASTR|nr:unnamed protein product [Lactuca virosa]